MRSFLEIQMLQQSKITMFIKRGVCSWDLKLSIAKKMSAWLGTWKPISPQQASAKGQCKKRCSNVSSVLLVHRTQLKEGKKPKTLISIKECFLHSTCLWVRARRKPCVYFDNLSFKSSDNFDVFLHDQSNSYRLSLRRRRDFPRCNSTSPRECSWFDSQASFATTWIVQPLKVEDGTICGRVTSFWPSENSIIYS